MILTRAALALAVMAGPALANPQCGERALVVAELGARYGETRQGVGLSAAGNMVELWANVESGSWTATYTDATGNTCIQGHGNAWQVLSDPLPPKGIPG